MLAVIGQRTTLLVALVAALPTLVWATWDPAFLVDDWAFALRSHLGNWSGYATEARARPLQALWHAGTFAVLGQSPRLHLLLMAILNAGVAALIWRLATRLLARRAALITVGVWVLLPNRGSTRFWIATGPSLVALALVLVACHLALEPSGLTRARHALVLLLVVAATLTYEGASGLGLVVLGIAVARGEPLKRLGRALTSSTVFLAALAYVAAASPKGVPSGQLGAAVRVLPAQFGVGVWPTVALPLGTAMMTVALWSLFRPLIRDQHQDPELRITRAGVGLLVAGAAPFVAAGFHTATDGLFDRGNLFAGLGTSVIFASSIEILARQLGHVAGDAWTKAATGALLSISAIAFATGIAVDLQAVKLAADDGRRLLVALDRSEPIARDRESWVIEPLPNRSGYAMFVDDYDIRSAVALRYATGDRRPSLRMALTPKDFESGPGGLRLQLRGRDLVPREGPPQGRE